MPWHPARLKRLSRLSFKRFAMSAPVDRQDVLIERFRSNLEVLSPWELIRKHITTGSPAEISDEDYFNLRRLIAAEFDIHPSAIVLVGSCRMGFSIVPKKRYQKAAPHADLDVALISSERFDIYWDDVFAYSRSDAAWKRTHEYRRFASMLFQGWIDPRGLPNVSRFERAGRWTDFFDSLMQSRRFGSRRISARLYRTWWRLEAYQEIAIHQCITNRGD